MDKWIRRQLKTAIVWGHVILIAVNRCLNWNLNMSVCFSMAASTRPPCRGPEPMCANMCPNGYRYKDDGCMTCDCLVTETRASSTRGRRRCRGPQPMCANRCPYGYKYKPDGCMTCECAEKPPPEICEVSACCCQFFVLFSCFVFMRWFAVNFAFRVFRLDIGCGSGCTSALKSMSHNFVAAPFELLQ